MTPTRLPLHQRTYVLGCYVKRLGTWKGIHVQTTGAGGWEKSVKVLKIEVKRQAVLVARGGGGVRDVVMVNG